MPSVWCKVFNYFVFKHLAVVNTTECTLILLCVTSEHHPSAVKTGRDLQLYKCRFVSTLNLLLSMLLFNHQLTA